LFVGAILLAAVAGGVVGLLTYLRPAPKPIFLSLAVTEYADRNFPVNAFAQQDSESLRKHFGDDSVQAFQSQERDLILRELNQLADRSRGADKGRPIIIHLSAHGLVQGGAVYIIPGNGKAGVAGTWIRLEELLDGVKRIQGDRLLLLDLKPIVDARLGILQESLPDRVQETLTRLQQTNDLPFLVATSCGPGSSPFVSRELARSAFGWFLDRGLAGVADGWNPGNMKDDRVSSQELVAFARDNVFAFSNRLGQAQLPGVYGKATDFVLLPVPQGGTPPAVKPETAEVFPAWLLAYWKERDQWREQGAHRRLQRTYRHLEAILRRAESQWLGGADAEKSQRELADEIQELRAVKQRFADPVLPLHSLGSAQKMEIKNLREAEAALRPIIDRIKAAPVPNMEDLAELQKARMALAAREKPLPPEAIASVIVASALESKELTIDQLKQLVLTWQSLPNPPKLVETLMLRFVTEVEPRRLKLWAPEPGTIPRILLAAQAAEKAVPADGRALPWLRKDLQETDDLRREAMRLLLLAEADDRDKARQQLDRCLNRYADIAEAGRGLENALRELDETRMFLADWADFEAPDEKIQQELDTLWASIVGECRQLLPLLKLPAPPQLPSAQLLLNKANDLQRRRERVLDLVKPPSSTSALDAQRWLAWPFGTADRRNQLAARMRDSGPGPVEQALQAEKPGNITAPPVDAAKRTGAAMRRAQRAIDLLTLAGDPEIGKLETKLAAATKNPDAQTMDELGQMIARRWSEQLPERYRQSTNRPEQVEIGWAIHPFDLPAIPRTGDTFPRDAAAEFYRQQQKELAAWVGERDQLDARTLAKVEGAGALAVSRALEELARDQLNWNP
jgi:hypothetical protein